MEKTTVCELNLRKADRQDSAFLLSVRNLPEVRAQSKTQSVISESTHAAWFDTQLDSPSAVIWILEHQGERKGYLRAQEIETGTWLLSIALETFSQRKGYGTWALREGRRLLQEHYGARCLMAEVFAANAAARRLFTSVGFSEKARKSKNQSDIIRFEFLFS